MSNGAISTLQSIEPNCTPHDECATRKLYGKNTYNALSENRKWTCYETYTEETTSEECKLIVQGETHEERLESLTKNIPAKRIMLAVALGDVLLNKLSHSQASYKYGFSKTMINSTSKKGNVKLNRRPPHLLKRVKAMTKTTRRKRLNRLRHVSNNPRNRISSRT